MSAELNTLLIALAAGAMSAAIAVLFISWRSGLRFSRQELLDRTVEPMVFLFQGNRLVDATLPARALLSTLAGDGDRMRIAAFLRMRFPDAPDLLAQAAEHGYASASGIGVGAAALRVEIEDMGQDVLRIVFTDPQAENAGITVDSQSLAAMEEELAILRDTIDNSPVMIWREDADGTVSWANSTYLREALPDDETVWPIPKMLDLPPGDGDGTPRRVRMDTPAGARWLDCHTRIFDGQRMICALPADATVRAESSLREFVQTLTKTFADLPTGLAIFDRRRNLQLFNPALINLTGLTTGFLTGRPSLYAFLDRLRESRMVPEPKDYRSWRHHMTTLESAAARGHHAETWTLPGGQTYRVTGRPHHDGAIALLFEDITSETSLTWRFRSELALGRELLDCVDEAVAVFDSNGRLAVSNGAYASLWGDNLPGQLSEHLTAWSSLTDDTAPLRDAIINCGDGNTRRGQLVHKNGDVLSWRSVALQNGRSAVIFLAPNAGNGTLTKAMRKSIPVLHEQQRVAGK